jgi:diguanylate cyclase (GGDEF)-like protein/PAS domain S-box-containing protein
MSTATRQCAEYVQPEGVSLRESARAFRTVFETMASAIFVYRGKLLSYVNGAAEVITGYTREELISMHFCDLIHPDFQDVMKNGTASRYEIKILTKDRQERWLDITSTPVKFDGVPGRLVSAFDFTEHKRVEERAQLLAVTDPLTGLGNYRCLLQVLDAEVRRFDRTGRPFAVLLLDLDDLKKVNDRYGHIVGSRALCRLGDVLRLHCRAIDTAARYGGDEFAVVLPETTATSAKIAACRIRDQLARENEQPALSVAIGVADYPQGGHTIEELLLTADRELYEIKNEAGKALRQEQNK